MSTPSSTPGHVISTILRHDSKVNSYKIVLLRAINDVVLAFPAPVTRIYTPPAPYLPPALDLTIFHAGQEIGDPANHVPYGPGELGKWAHRT